ncbi:MAG: TRAP transporter TatT component family protein [Vicinamibacterales bacterium]
MLVPQARAQSADALYAERENPASAKQAATLLADDARQHPTAFEPAWKLARICYWLGTHAPEKERRAFLEQGVTAGQTAARLAPNRPEGYFWAAATMGALAESFGLRAGMKYRKPIREALETVLRIDPSFMQGSADRALGRYYARVPSLFGGSRTKAEQHLRASLQYNADSTISRYFLAELLLDQKRTADARAELDRVIAAPLSVEWAPEDRDYKEKARTLLATLR